MEGGRDLKRKLLYVSADSEWNEEIAVVERSETGDRAGVSPQRKERETVGVPSAARNASGEISPWGYHKKIPNHNLFTANLLTR
jgi:hypothetical protein